MWRVEKEKVGAEAKEQDRPKDQELLLKLKRTGITHLNITGGEPLLRPDLPELLKQAKNLNLHVTLCTNGILYAEQAKVLQGLIDELYFSLDYPFEEMHDRSRGVECFHLAIKAIKLAQELGQQPIINFTLTRDSVLYLPDMVDLADRLKVRVYLNPVYDFSGTQGFELPTHDHIKYYSRRKNVLVNLAVLLFTKNHGNKVLYPRCFAKETTVTVLPDGKIVQPCFFNQGGKEGREDVCSGCMRWDYMLPSFSAGFDKYFWLNLVSQALRRFKR